MLHKIIPILVLITATLFADSIPKATGSQPGSQLIGESFSQQLCFENNGTATGYEPQFEVVTPAGIKLTAATFYGNPVISHQETCMANECNVSNPIIGQPSFFSPVDGNESYYILDFPIGSFSTEWPQQCMDLTFELESSGDHVQPGNPLDIKTVGVFSLGETPVDDGNYTYGPEQDLTVIPNVYTMEKSNSATEGERATGEKYPIVATIVVDIANDENLTNLQVVDDLDGGMQFKQIISNAGCAETQLPSTFSPGGTLILDCSSRTGVLGPDLAITYEYYIPEKDENNDSILGGNCQWKPLINHAYANAEHDFNNTQTPLIQIDANSTVTAKAITMLKTSSIISDAPPAGFGPGDVIEYSLTMDISEFADQDNLLLSDVIGDGQTYDKNTPNSYTLSNGLNGSFDPNNNIQVTYDPNTGTSLIEFNLSQQLTDDGHPSTVAAGTTITVTFQTTVDEYYKVFDGGSQITMGDTIENHIDLLTTMPDGTVCPVESSSTSNTVNTATIEKTVYKINGNDPGAKPYLIHPGDNVTYRLKTILPVESFHDFKLLDYLPIPFFRADQITTEGSSGSTNPGEWAPGPDNNYSKPPIFSADPSQNSLTWTFGDDNVTQRGTVIDMLFTVTATHEPMADALTLANITGIRYKNSEGVDLGEADLVTVITAEPFVDINKTIIATTNDQGQSFPTVSLDKVDANDTITFRIHLENTGHAEAYNVGVKDILPVGLHSCTVLSLDGNSTGNHTEGDLFNTTYRIDKMLPMSYADINYDCVVDQNASPGPDIVNKAILKDYYSTSNTADQNSSTNFVKKSIESSTELILEENTSLTKTLYHTSLPDTSGNNLNPGEIAYFEINATLGEGTYIAFNISDSVCDNPPVLFDNSTNVHFNGSDLVIEGTPGTSTGTVSYRCSYQTTVNSPKTSNTARMTATNITEVVSNPVNWTVTDPNPNPSKVMNPADADAGDTITVTMDWESNSTANPSYQCSVTDQLDDAFDWTTVNITQTPSGYNCSADPLTGLVTCDYSDTTTACGDGPAVFTVKIKDDVIVGGTIVNEIEFKGFTLPSDHNKSTDPNYNGSTDENASADLRLLSPAKPVKIFTATSENFTDPGDLHLNNTPEIAIGEVIDVNITYGFYEGTTLNVQLDERFLDGGRLVYVPGSMTISRNDANLNVTNSDINNSLSSVPVNTAVSVDDSNLTINNTLVSLPVGNVLNLNSSSGTSVANLTLHFRVKVQNETAVQAGELIRDRGRVRFEDSMSPGTINRSQSTIVSATTVEPLPSITKDVNQTAVQAGTHLIYTVQVCNDENNDSLNPNHATSAFEWIISDRIPDDILLSSGPTVDLNGTGAVVDTSASTGQDINATIDRLDRGECISISYEAIVQQSAQFGQVMTNTAKFQTTSLPGIYGSAGSLSGLATQEPGELNGERTGIGGVNDLFGHNDATVVMNKNSLNKILRSPQPYYAIGEEAQYRIRVDMTRGLAKNFVVNDILPAGLELNTSSLVFGFVGGVFAEHNPPLVTQNANVVSFDYGDINVTTPAQLVIDYNATVTNVLSNQDGVSLRNEANATFNDPNNPGQTITVEPGVDPLPVKVGEPNLFMDKKITAGAVKAQAGSVVSWEVTIANNGHTTAYAADWEDTLPSHLAQINNAALTLNGTPAVLSGTTTDLNSSHLVENNTTLSLPPFDLPVDSTVTVTFDSIVQNDAVAGETQTNHTDASYKSILGADGSPLGGRNSDDCGDDDDDTALNNYCESATADLVIDAGIAIDKHLQNTDDRFTIGEQVTYEMRVSVIEGITPHVVLTDTLPAGLKYLSHTCQDAGGTHISFDCNLSSTSPVTINFGDVDNPADGNDTNDYIDVELTVLVENVVGNQNGYTPENGDTAGTLVTVTSDVNSSAVTVPVPITITEPDLSVVKTATPTISGTPGQALGDIITYHIRLAHTAGSTSDAYDVNFTDTLDPGLIYIPGSATGATVTQNGQVLTFGFAHLPQGTVRDISYKAQIDPNAVVGMDLNNSLDTVYGGLPDANGSIDGGRNGTDGIGGALNDYALHTSIAVTPNDDALTPRKSIMGTKDLNNDGLVSAGDLIEYNLSVSNNLGYDVGEVNVTDTLNQDLTLMLNSIKVYHNSTVLVDTNTSSTDWSVSGYWYTYADNNVTIEYNGDTNYFEVYWSEMLEDGGTFDVTFDAKINDGDVTTVVFGNNPGDTLDINRSNNVRVIAGTTIDNTFTVDSNRTVPTPSNEVNTTTDQRGMAGVPEKVIYGSDQSFTTPPYVAVGEVIDVKLTFGFSGGTTKAVILKDNFDRKHFVRVGDANLTRVSGLEGDIWVGDFNSTFGTSTDTIAVEANITDTADGFELKIGDIFNPTYQDMNITSSLELTFRLRVDNNTTVQSGAMLSDNGSVVYDKYISATEPSVPVELASESREVFVVEPDVEITKKVNPASARAGDEVAYTLNVCNDESNTTAHTTSGFDWHITDTLPDELDLVGDPQYNGNPMFSGKDLDVVIPEIKPGECVLLEYNVTINGIAEFEQDINNTVRVESTSLPGSAPGERTGTGIVPDDLNASSTAVLSVDQPSIEKYVTAPKEHYAIGDIVEYNLTVSFTGSAKEVEIFEHLPEGLRYVPGSVKLFLPTDVNVSHPTPVEIPGVGNEIVFVVGDFNVTTSGQFYIEFNTTVEDIGSNIDGQRLPNTVDLNFKNINGEPVTIPSHLMPVITVGEPDLIMSKNLLNYDPKDPKSIGDVIEFEIIIENIGNTKAYKVNWHDILPEHIDVDRVYIKENRGAYDLNSIHPVDDSNFTIVDNNVSLLFDLDVGGRLVIGLDTKIVSLTTETLTNVAYATTQSQPNGGRVYKPDGINPNKYAAVGSASFSINQLPEAIDDCNPPLHVTHYGANNGDCAANDTLGDGTKAEHTWRLITPPTNGTVVVNKDGTYVYTPDANYNGPDGFIYEIEDNNGDKDRAQVCIDVDCASTQTSDGGNALNMAGMLLMLFFTGLIGIYYVRREEVKGVDHE